MRGEERDARSMLPKNEFFEDEIYDEEFTEDEMYDNIIVEKKRKRR